MLFRSIDFLTPRITLYQQGYSSHTSICSGIISLITAIVIILFAVYYSIDFIDKKTPSGYYFQRFVENAGSYPINSSSFFHYIGMESNTTTSNVDEGFDFTSFRVIGTETLLNTYINELNKNLTSIDHWLYGPCERNDISDLSKLININSFTKCACIKKYYNSLKNTYYDTDDPNFRWPRMAYGTFNSKNEFYNVIVEGCNQNTLNLIMEENASCKNDEYRRKLISSGAGLYFNFIDSYIDVLDYKHPIHQYVFTIESSLDNDNYSTNHLNFRPSLIRSNKGIIADQYKEEYSLEYDRNDVFTSRIEESGIYNNYYFWLNNRLQYYGRVYKKLEDVISDIGGSARVITFIASVINYIFYQYVTITDTDHLIFLYNNGHRSNLFKKNSIDSNIQKKEDGFKVINDNASNSIHQLNINKQVLNQKNDNNLQKENESLPNLSTKSIEESSNNSLNEDKKKLSFCSYLIYKITCCPKSNIYYKYVKFRKNILSEEEMMKNHLNLYNLMKNNSGRTFVRSFTLKDVLNNR